MPVPRILWDSVEGPKNLSHFHWLWPVAYIFPKFTRLSHIPFLPQAWKSGQLPQNERKFETEHWKYTHFCTETWIVGGRANHSFLRGFIVTSGMNPDRLHLDQQHFGPSLVFPNYFRHNSEFPSVNVNRTWFCHQIQ